MNIGNVKIILPRMLRVLQVLPRPQDLKHKPIKGINTYEFVCTELAKA